MSGRPSLKRRIAERPGLGRTTEGADTMGQFLYLYRMADAARQEAMGTPERAQKSIQAKHEGPPPCLRRFRLAAPYT